MLLWGSCTLGARSLFSLKSPFSIITQSAINQSTSFVSTNGCDCFMLIGVYLKVYLQSSCYGNRDRFILWWYFGGPALWIFTFPWVAVWHEMHWSIFKIPYLKSHIYALSLSLYFSLTHSSSLFPKSLPLYHFIPHTTPNPLYLSLRSQPTPSTDDVGMATGTKQVVKSKLPASLPTVLLLLLRI